MYLPQNVVVVVMPHGGERPVSELVMAYPSFRCSLVVETSLTEHVTGMHS